MPLAGPLDWAILFVLAAVSGIVGGVCAAVIAVYYPAVPQSPRETLESEWPRLALVGAVAAIAVLYINNPTTTVVTQAADGTVTSTTVTYDLLKVIPLGLIAGTAGRAVLEALQARVSAAINAQKVVEVAALGKQLTEDVGRAAKTEVHAAVQDVTSSAREGVQRLVQEAGQEAVADALMEDGVVEEGVVEEGVATDRSPRGAVRSRPVTLRDEDVQRVLETAGGGAAAAAESRLSERVQAAKTTIDAFAAA